MAMIAHRGATVLDARYGVRTPTLLGMLGVNAWGDFNDPLPVTGPGRFLATKGTIVGTGTALVLSSNFMYIALYWPETAGTRRLDPITFELVYPSAPGTVTGETFTVAPQSGYSWAEMIITPTRVSSITGTVRDFTVGNPAYTDLDLTFLDGPATYDFYYSRVDEAILQDVIQNWDLQTRKIGIPQHMSSSHGRRVVPNNGLEYGFNKKTFNVTKRVYDE